ncbi:MAG: T9SS type A sorting domain-containing protein [Bacteroidales bacterium]|jgi:hypothetical protein|nr:T9SS type A sorting domain-containing protein [Bacteroidales bacterium]
MFIKKTYTTKLGNEVVLNDIVYYELLTTKDKNASVWEHAGYIREDVTERKEYYKPRIDVQEVLLYNFAAEVGDVFQTYDIQCFDGSCGPNHIEKYDAEITVEAVDYIEINGSPRKRMQVKSSANFGFPQYQTHTWIEGIGNMNGLLRSTDALQAMGREQVYLLCFLQNAALVHKPEDAKSEECFVWEEPYRTETHSFQNAEIVIYPNPVEDVVTIFPEDTNISLVEIFDMTGQKLYSQAHDKEINVSSFVKGNYLLVVHTTNGGSYSYTFVKK